MYIPARYIKRGANEAHISIGLARRKPEKKITANVVKSKFISCVIKVKRDYPV